MDKSTLDTLTGALLYGSMFNWSLTGVMIMQSYMYILWYSKRDRRPVIALVAAMVLIELVQTSLTTHTIHGFFVTYWGNSEVIIYFPWSFISAPIISGIVATLVQWFFSWRIWLLGSHKAYTFIAGLIAILSLIQCLNALIVASLYAKGSRDITETDPLRIFAKIWLSSCFACDCLIAIVMVIILSGYKSKTVQQTSNLLNRLIIKSIESGSITALTTMLHLALYLQYYSTNWAHLAPFYIGGKLYANILLANLNGRDRMAGLASSTGAQIVDIAIPLAHQPATRSQQVTNARSSISERISAFDRTIPKLEIAVDEHVHKSYDNGIALQFLQDDDV